MYVTKASLVAQILPATPVWSLDWEDLLEESMAIPWTEEHGGVQHIASQRVGHNWATKTFTFHLIQQTSCFNSITTKSSKFIPES